MDKPLQTELRLSDVSLFCFHLSKSCGWDLVREPINGERNMESVTGTQGEACSVWMSTWTPAQDCIMVHAVSARPSVLLWPWSQSNCCLICKSIEDLKYCFEAWKYCIEVLHILLNIRNRKLFLWSVNTVSCTQIYVYKHVHAYGIWGIALGLL